MDSNDAPNESEEAEQQAEAERQAEEALREKMNAAQERAETEAGTVAGGDRVDEANDGKTEQVEKTEDPRVTEVRQYLEDVCGPKDTQGLEYKFEDGPCPHPYENSAASYAGSDSSIHFWKPEHHAELSLEDYKYHAKHEVGHHVYETELSEDDRKEWRNHQAEEYTMNPEAQTYVKEAMLTGMADDLQSAESRAEEEYENDPRGQVQIVAGIREARAADAIRESHGDLNQALAEHPGLGPEINKVGSKFEEQFCDEYRERITRQEKQRH